MDELYTMLVQLGPRWMGFIMLGTVGGAIAYIVGHRQNMRMVKVGHEEQIKLKDETIAMLKTSKDEAVAILLRGKDEATKERDTYRDRLHEEKANHQGTLLRLNQSEQRPDLGQILSMEQNFHTEKVKMNQAMITLLERMNTKLDQEFIAHSNMCKQTYALMQGIVKQLNLNLSPSEPQGGQTSGTWTQNDQ